MRGFQLSGAGNDFLALVEPPSGPPPEMIRSWCTRGLSLGADGLFLLERREGSARMRHFNSDGSSAKLCINGTRCAARLAFHLGWAADRIRIVTDAGEFEARSLGSEEIGVTLPVPRSDPQETALELDGETVRGWRIDVGVPHLVVPWDGPMESAPVATLGPRLRRHPELGRAGANVDFVAWRRRDRMEIRSFERGVEAETLACGTGVLAAVATGLALGRLGLPVAALTLGGCTLRVEPRDAGWSLNGDARLLATLELEPGAVRIPSPVGWR